MTETPNAQAGNDADAPGRLAEAGSTAHGLWSEFRMLVAEWLIGAALSAAPTGHPEATRLALYVREYARGGVERAKERLGMQDVERP